MCGGWTMPAYFFRSEPGAAELRRLARRESGRVCQRVLMIANLLEGIEHEEATRLARLTNGITTMKRMALKDCVTGRARVGSPGWTP